MSEVSDRVKAIDLIYAWDDDDSGTYADLAELIATALAAERERARAPFLALADELGAFANARVHAASGSYDDGLRRAQANAALHIRLAAQDSP